MVLQPTRRTAEEYCYPRGGLLPHLLTLTLAGGYFLLRYYTLTDIKQLTCAVLYVARTFLPHPKVAAMERICSAKVAKFGQYTKNATTSMVKNRPPSLLPSDLRQILVCRLVHLLELYVLGLRLSSVVILTSLLSLLALLSLLSLLLSVDILRCCLPSGIQRLDR